MRLIKMWMMALAGAALLSACGDGSLRSPALIGAGPLVSMELQCFTPEGQACPEPTVVLVGDHVNYRVIGTFANGSEADVTDRPNIVLSDGGRGEVTLATGGAQKGRAQGAEETPANDPVVITASDSSNPDLDPQERELHVVDGTPTQVQIFQNSICTQPADGETLASGQPLQLYARISFDHPLVQPLCRTADNRLTWSSDPAQNPDNSQVISGSGLFVGKNVDPDNVAEFEVTAEWEGEEGTAVIFVQQAELEADSLRIVPPAVNIPIGGTVTYQAFITFRINNAPDCSNPDDCIEMEVTDGTDFSLTDPEEDRAEFQSDNVLIGLAPTVTEEGTNDPVRVTGAFEGQTDEAIVNILDALTGAKSIHLVPVGVEPFEDAGFFNIEGATEEELDEARQRIADDALRLGLDENGRVPCISGDGEECPLPLHQTMPAKALGYAVFAFAEGDAPGQPDAQGLLLENLTLTCSAAENEILPVHFAVDDDNIVTLLRELEMPGEPGENGEPGDPIMVPVTTASGIHVVLAEGGEEGLTTIRARLGATFDGGAEHGFNCLTFEDDIEEGADAVEDAEQEVKVGIVDDDGNPIDPILATHFNIDRNYMCVGWLDAVDFEQIEDFIGNDKLLTSLTYILGPEGNERQVIVNMNQSPRVNFRPQSGPAQIQDGQQSCRNDEAEDPVPPIIRITNALHLERGAVFAVNEDGTSALALGVNCAAAAFDAPDNLPGFVMFDEEENDITVRQRAATVTLLPADDNIVRGPDGQEEGIDQLCDALGPLLTLPIGQLAGAENQGAGLLTELVGLLGGILQPILQNEMINGVSVLLNELLTEVQGLLGALFDATGLDDVLDGLLCDVLGLCLPGDDPPVEGITLLPAVLEVVEELLTQIRDAWIDATGGVPEPETVDPGDPFRDPAPEPPEG